MPQTRDDDSCPTCSHDWREHPGGAFEIPVDGVCGECRYELDHDQRESNAPPCRLPAAPPTRHDDQRGDPLGRGWRRLLLALAFTPSALAFAAADHLLTRSWLWAVPLVALLIATVVLARQVRRSDPA